MKKNPSVINGIVLTIISAIYLLVAAPARAKEIPDKCLPQSPISALVDYRKNDLCADFLTRDKDSLEHLSKRGTFEDTKRILYESPLIARTKPAPDGVLFGTKSGSVYWYSPNTGSFDCLFSLDAEIQSVSRSEDGKFVAAVAGNKGYIRNMPSGTISLIDAQVLRNDGDICSILLNADGSMMIVRIVVSDDYESFTYTYLVDAKTKQAMSQLKYYCHYGFTPDGKQLVSKEYDYYNLDDRDHPYESFCVSSFAGKEIVKVSYPDSETHETKSSYDPYADYFPDAKKPLPETPFLGWSEFGLESGVWLRNVDATGRQYDIRTLLAGTVEPPDLGAYVNRDSNYDNNYKLGFYARATDEDPYPVIMRIDQKDIHPGKSIDFSAAKKLWTKKVISNESAINYCSLVVPEENTVAVYLPKYRVNADKTELSTKSFVRLLDWTTGRAIGPDIDLSGSDADKILKVGPERSYLILGDGSNQWNIYWPNKGIYRSWNGTKLYRGDGIQEFTPADAGSITFIKNYVRYWIPDDTKQIGNVISLAINPSQTLFATIDEAGQFFITEIATGKVLFATRFILNENGSLVLEQSIPENIALRETEPVKPSLDFVKNPLSADKFKITKAPAFNENPE
jgi:hypothetical protein